MNNKNIIEKNAKIPDIVQQKANAAFREIYNRQDEPDEKPQKTYRSARATIIKIATSVVAAAITIVVLFVAIAYFGGQGSAFPGGNRFSIKVCAAELEPKASLPISLDVSKQTFGHYVDWTGYVNYQINFPVSVEGENISSVTFKADNAFIEVVSIDCPSIVKSGSPKTLADFNSTYVDGNDMSGHPIGKTEVGYYDSFSADYATLQNSKYLLNICSELTDRMDLYYLLNHEGSDDDSCAAYTYLLKDVKVTIEVTFNDGTKSSKTLRLYSKPFSATDKAVDGTEYTYNTAQIFCYDENNADDAVKKLISSQITRAAKICKAEEATATEETTATEAASTEATTTKTESKEVSTGSHKVKVEVVTLKSYMEFTRVVPRLFVDGKEATELNKSLSDYLLKKYRFDVDDEHNDGMSTRIEWGVKDNIVSFIIYASSTSEDYSTSEVLNYDLDTLMSLKPAEVTKRLGMTDEELFSKVNEIVKDYCKEDEKSYTAYDYNKSSILINYDKLTPFIMPDGSAGVSATVVYSDQTQFAGLECVRLFKLKV